MRIEGFEVSPHSTRQRRAADGPSATRHCVLLDIRCQDIDFDRGNLFHQDAEDSFLRDIRKRIDDVAAIVRSASDASDANDARSTGSNQVTAAPEHRALRGAMWALHPDSLTREDLDALTSYPSRRGHHDTTSRTATRTQAPSPVQSQNGYLNYTRYGETTIVSFNTGDLPPADTSCLEEPYLDYTSFEGTTYVSFRDFGIPPGSVYLHEPIPDADDVSNTQVSPENLHSPATSVYDSSSDECCIDEVQGYTKYEDATILSFGDFAIRLPPGNVFGYEPSPAANDVYFESVSPDSQHSSATSVHDSVCVVAAADEDDDMDGIMGVFSRGH